jgi:serine/threonine protein kinase
MESTKRESLVTSLICPSCGEKYPADDARTHCPSDGALLAPDSQANVIGTVIADRYRIDSLIGEGGFSHVYKAWQESLRRFVSIKIMRARLISDIVRVKRFQIEAEAAAKLKHPGIAAVYDFGILPNGQPFIVMEYIDGRSLAEIVLEDGPISSERCIDVFSQACDALQSAHDSGVVHRDIKPSNIMVVTEDGGKDKVKILDFGLVKVLAENNNELTKTGETVGTPAYMSPEQCLGQAVDGRTDQYNLGCSMYLALSGVAAFSGESMFDCMHNQIYKYPPALAEVNPALKVPPALEAVIFKSLEKDQNKRFASLSDLKNALLNSSSAKQSNTPLGSEANPKHPHPLSTDAQQAKTDRDKALKLTLVAATVCALVAGVVFAPRWFPAQEKTAAIPPVVVYKQDAAGPIDGPSVDLSSQHVTAPQLKQILAQTPELASMVIENTAIPADVIEVIGEFRQLKKLDLAHSGFGQNSLATVKYVTLPPSHFGTLKFLRLSFSGIRDEGMPFFTSAKALEELDLSCTNTDSTGLRSLPDLPNLKTLKIHFTRASDSAMIYVSAYKNLEVLNLSSTKVTDEGISHLADLQALRILDLSSSRGITDGALWSLAKLPKLTELKLASTSIGDAGCAALSQIVSLHDLDLSSTAVTNEGLEVLASLPALENLNLSECPRITKDAIAKFKNEHPRCRVF